MIYAVIFSFVLIVCYWRYFLTVDKHFRRSRKKCGGKITRRFYGEVVRFNFRYRDAEIEILPPSFVHGATFPMNLRLVSGKSIFNMTPETKERLFDIGRKHGDFNMTCEMKYLKIFPKNLRTCRVLDSMIAAAEEIYDHASIDG